MHATISKDKAPATTILNTRILFNTDGAEGGPGWLDAQIVEAFDTNLTMVSREQEKLVTSGLDAVLARKSAKYLPFRQFYVQRGRTEIDHHFNA